MSVLVWMKCFGDLCYYFSLIYAFPKLFPTEGSGLPAAVLLSLGAFWAAFCEDQVRWYRWRRLGLICPVACLGLWARSMGMAAILLPPCIYVAVLTLRGGMRLQYYDYRAFFRRSMIPWSILFLVLLLMGGFDQLTTNAFDVDYQNMLFYGIFSLAVGVVLLRGLRLGVESDLKRGLGQLAELAAVLAGAALVAWLLRSGSVWLRWLLQKVGFVLMLPWVMLVKSVDALRLERVEEIAETVAEETAEAEVALPEAPQAGEALIRLSELLSEVPALLRRIPWETILVILILAAAAAMLICFGGHFFLSRSYGSEGGLPQGGAVPGQRKTRRRREGRRSNREKVRAVYRDYLKLVRRREVRLTPSMTSQDVLRQTQRGQDSREAVRLREIYLAARYQEQEEVTGEQVREARAALNALRRSP